jgi:hypothetical protein
MRQGFLAARRRPNFDRVALLVEMMAGGVGSELGVPCVSGQVHQCLGQNNKGNNIHCDI